MKLINTGNPSRDRRECSPVATETVGPIQAIHGEVTEKRRKESLAIDPPHAKTAKRPTKQEAKG
jgi:hypothetical protein